MLLLTMFRDLVLMLALLYKMAEENVSFLASRTASTSKQDIRGPKRAQYPLLVLV